MERRIVTLFPAGTELVFALGFGDSVVATSHECDYPAPARTLPHALGSECPTHGSSLEIDEWVSSRHKDGLPLYELNVELLTDLRPTHIVAQRLCDVCAVGYDSVEKLARALPSQPSVIYHAPVLWKDILRDIHLTGEWLHDSRAADQLVHSMLTRIEALPFDGTARPRVAVIEWFDPLYRCGHWTPEVIEFAGGTELLGKPGAKATPMKLEELIDVDPDLVLLSCCGFDIQRTIGEFSSLCRRQPKILDLAAMQERRIAVLDGNAYLSRPGPRLVRAIEIIHNIIHHPELETELHWIEPESQVYHTGDRE